jgi:Alpha/beta hydrolase domain
VKAFEAPGQGSRLPGRSGGGPFRGRTFGPIWHWILSLALGSVAALSAAAHATVPTPTVTGPIAATAIPGDPSHNYPFFASDKDLATNGYVEEEFLIQGSANRYTTPGLATGTVIDSGHPYLTRLIVRRPVDPRRFNGTVLVEWLNVTYGFDLDYLWFFDWEHVLREGYAWVGVSAQNGGVATLVSWNPTRYAGLDVTQGGKITGDDLSYDIFSQVGQAIRYPLRVDLLGGLKPRVIIATGESQSASRLSTYVNSINPLANAYDGFLLLSTLGNIIRTDLTVPVWKVLTEWDVFTSEAAVRQPDTTMFRTWEVAGSSHEDEHLRKSREPLELRDFSTSTGASSSAALLARQCQVPTIGTRVPTGYVVGQAFDLLVRWVKNRTQPPSAPRIAVSSVIERDSNGLALGGIRLSQLAVPTAVNVGVNAGPGACQRWGYYIPFPISQLDSLYPTHDGYVAQFAKITLDNLQNQYIEAADAQQTVLDAINSTVGKENKGGAIRSTWITISVSIAPLSGCSVLS